MKVKQEAALGREKTGGGLRRGMLEFDNAG